jgi:low affinity Fe/Cu permease
VEKFYPYLTILGKGAFQLSKILIFVVGFVFVAIWKIVGHFLGMSQEMADYFAFGKVKKRRGDRSLW